MSTAPFRTQQARTSRTVSLDKAVAAAQSEVARAQSRIAAIERDFHDRLDAAHSWLAETERRLRVAVMQQRRADPVEHAEAIDPAPWLPDAWIDKTTIDPTKCREDD